MITRTFQRYELKYRLDTVQYQMLRRLMDLRMEPDEYCRDDGTYMVYNLYFDTEHNDIIRHSTSRPVFKEKLRLRCYKLPLADEDMVYLELKRKLAGVVNKRRATLRFGDARKFLASGRFPADQAGIDRQVLAEIAAFLEHCPCRPKVYLSYERLALHGREDPAFRVTFDRSILTRRDQPDFFAGDYGSELLDDDEVLMEVKINGAMPLWLARELSRLGIYSSSFSKIGEEYQANKCFSRPPAAASKAVAAATSGKVATRVAPGMAAAFPVGATFTGAALAGAAAASPPGPPGNRASVW